MSNFLWCILIILGISVLSKLYYLAEGTFPERDNFQEATYVVIQGAIITWDIVLLLNN